MKIDAFHYVQLGTAYRSVSSENHFLNAHICKGGLINLSVCSWQTVGFFSEQSTVLSGLSCLHLLLMLTWHIIAGSYFSQAFQAKCVWEDLELFVMVNDTSGHVLCVLSELQLQHIWVNVFEQTVQLGKDRSVYGPHRGLSSPGRSVSQH